MCYNCSTTAAINSSSSYNLHCSRQLSTTPVARYERQIAGLDYVATQDELSTTIGIEVHTNEYIHKGTLTPNHLIKYKRATKCFGSSPFASRKCHG